MSKVVVNGNSSTLAGSQRSMVDSIVYTFSQPVSLGSGAVTIAVHSGQTGTLPALGWSSPDGGLTWIVTFSGSGVVGKSIANGVYDITLHAAAVTTVTGGTAMIANRTDTFYRLFGDVQGTHSVNAYDQSQFNLAVGSKSGQANYLPALDYNADGTIGSADKTQFNLDFGKSFAGVTATI